MAMPAQTRESGFKTNPDYKILFEPSPRRVRVKFNGEIIADSTNTHLLFETRHLPVYYFPRSDVRMDRMTPTDHHTFCPYKGTASYWTIAVGDKVAENALWGYPRALRGGGGDQGLRRVLLEPRRCLVRGGRRNFRAPARPL